MNTKHSMSLLETLQTANDIASTLEQMVKEIEQAGQTYVLGSCYEAAHRLLKTWWPTSTEAIAKATGKQP